MAADLPPGRWSAVLVGPWWPAPSAALRAAAQHWATWAMQKQELARNLISQHDLLLRNQGRTAEDLIGRYLRGAKSEVTKAEKYEIKKGAFNTAADAIDYLRSRLTGIAGEGNKEIDDVLASKSRCRSSWRKSRRSNQVQCRCGERIPGRRRQGHDGHAGDPRSRRYR